MGSLQERRLIHAVLFLPLVLSLLLASNADTDPALVEFTVCSHNRVNRHRVRGGKRCGDVREAGCPPGVAREGFSDAL